LQKCSDLPNLSSWGTATTIGFERPTYGINAMDASLTDKGDVWLVLSLTAFLALSDSFIGALRQAYQLSVRTSSPWDAPSALVLIGSDRRIDAEEIVRWWRRLGWMT
jgi:hypothetical protein